jgi:hypothetical protein
MDVLFLQLGGSRYGCIFLNTHTHTHTNSNEVKYTNYYNCSKWREVPQFNYGQSEQGIW